MSHIRSDDDHDNHDDVDGGCLRLGRCTKVQQEKKDCDLRGKMLLAA